MPRVEYRECERTDCYIQFSTVDHPDQRFCSKSCAKIGTRNRNKGAQSTRPPGQLNKAIAAIRDKGLSYRLASEQYGIPASSLFVEMRRRYPEAAGERPVRRTANTRFISRLDYARSKGWWVRIILESKPLVAKLFSDNKFGGRTSALRAARAWRDEQLVIFADQIALSKTGRRVRRSSSRNRTGIIGVVFELHRRKKDRIAAWRAIWTDATGKSCFKRFSVSALGYREAYLQAVKWRAEITGLPLQVLRVPSEKTVLAKSTSTKEKSPDHNGQGC